MYSTFRLKAEDQLLLCCARTNMDDKNEKLIKSLVESNLDWDYISKMATKHKLNSLLYYQLNKICFNKVPYDYIKYLKEFLNRNALKNLFFLKEIVKIIQSLNEEGIQSVPYKGPILAQQVYGNLSLRQFADLDLFVKKDDVKYIKEILISKGYKPEFTLNSNQEYNYLNSQRELKFFNQMKGISLELHWKFSGIFLNLPSNAEKIFLSDLNSRDTGGVFIQEISVENLILILSVHNASHHWSRLAWLVDIATLINNNKIDWPKVLKTAKKLSIQKILFINLYLCQTLLDLKLENDIIRFLNNNSVINTSHVFVKNIFLQKKEKSLIDNMKISMEIREHAIDGITDCLMGIFHPSFYELNHLTLPKSLFFIYYIYRPLNLLKRYKLFK